MNVARPAGKVRTEIAHEVHEGLSQQMVGLLLAARALESNLTRKNIPETADAAYLVAQLQAAQRDVARLVEWLDHGRPR